MKSLRLVKLLTTASNNTSTSIRKHMPQYKYVNTTRIFQFCTPSCTMCNVHCARAHEYFVSMEIRFEQNHNQMHRNISYVNKYIYIFDVAWPICATFYLHTIFPSWIMCSLLIMGSYLCICWIEIKMGKI